MAFYDERTSYYKLKESLSKVRTYDELDLIRKRILENLSLLNENELKYLVNEYYKQGGRYSFKEELKRKSKQFGYLVENKLFKTKESAIDYAKKYGFNSVRESLLNNPDGDDLEEYEDKIVWTDESSDDIFKEEYEEEIQEGKSVKVTNIEPLYSLEDLDPDAIRDRIDKGIYNSPEELLEDTIEYITNYIKDTLGDPFIIEVPIEYCDNDGDVEEYITDYIADETGYLVDSYNWEYINNNNEIQDYEELDKVDESILEDLNEDNNKFLGKSLNEGLSEEDKKKLYPIYDLLDENKIKFWVDGFTFGFDTNEDRNYASYLMEKKLGLDCEFDNPFELTVIFEEDDESLKESSGEIGEFTFDEPDNKCLLFDSRESAYNYLDNVAKETSYLSSGDYEIEEEDYFFPRTDEDGSIINGLVLRTYYMGEPDETLDVVAYKENDSKDELLREKKNKSKTEAFSLLGDYDEEDYDEEEQNWGYELCIDGNCVDSNDGYESEIGALYDAVSAIENYDFDIDYEGDKSPEQFIIETTIDGAIYNDWYFDEAKKYLGVDESLKEDYKAFNQLNAKEKETVKKAYNKLKNNPKLYAVIYAYNQGKEKITLNPVLGKYSQEELDNFVKSFSKGKEATKVNVDVLYQSKIKQYDKIFNKGDNK